MKNEKFLLDIQTKCGDIANEILNAVIDAERTFKCKWPNNPSVFKKKLSSRTDPFIFPSIELELFLPSNKEVNFL